ncbi:hypothetical protein EVAR_48778_1 [Eumeta japonica]|uniref:Uncharacterized protein n=1 Tax=Eumeta variegata TaxID=151549 RepID=A0A4C1Y0G6_EUMVA|nr:hypothetical protein EVAR_48778_1 [Eumeta japonica]
MKLVIHSGRSEIGVSRVGGGVAFGNTVTQLGRLATEIKYVIELLYVHSVAETLRSTLLFAGSVLVGDCWLTTLVTIVMTTSGTDWHWRQELAKHTFLGTERLA